MEEKKKKEIAEVKKEAKEEKKEPRSKGRYFAKKKPVTRIGFFITCIMVDVTVAVNKLTRQAKKIKIKLRRD